MAKKLKKYQIGSSPNQLTGTPDPTWNLQQANTPNHQWNGFTGDPALLTFGAKGPEGYTLDPDGVYRKKEITEDKNKQQYSPFFQAFNAALDVTQLIANGVTDAKTSQDERKRLLEARYMTPQSNPYEKGINNVPVYLEHGGGVEMFPYGGGPLTAQGAKEILRDGKIKGHPLTDKQKRYFGYIAGGGTPHKQVGGFVNNTGYLKGAPTAANPMNIIPSGNITTEGMAFPIIANGMPLMPNTGDYKFNSKFVVEKPMQAGGGTMPNIGWPHELDDYTALAQYALQNAEKLKLKQNGNFKARIPMEYWNDDMLNYTDKFKIIQHKGEGYIKVRGKLVKFNPGGLEQNQVTTESTQLKMGGKGKSWGKYKCQTGGDVPEVGGMYNIGDIVDLTEEQIEELKSRGYSIEKA